MSNLEAWLFDLSTISNKMAISKFQLDIFEEKRRGKGLVAF